MPNHVIVAVGMRGLELYPDELRTGDLLTTVAEFPVIVAAPPRLTLDGRIEILVRRLGRPIRWPITFAQEDWLRVYRA
jgi:hypothetical protein